MHQISRQEVADYAAYLASPNDFPGYEIPASILEYPGNGDVSINEDLTIAPFWDINADGLYRPEDGDYPKYDIFNTASSGGGCSNFLFGDQTLFWVFNDKGNIHSESGGQPMGLEIRAQAFAFATNDEINDMTFYQYQIINRSNVTISNTYFGSWNDPDLGQYDDDFVGCDVENGLGFCYNSDDQDGSGSGNSYGDKPPCSAVDFFKGPKADPFYINGALADVPADSTISGAGYGDGIIGNETLGMEYFMIFKNDQSAQGNPSQATHFYNYLQSKWKDGTNLTYGGSGYGGSVSATCKFGFPWTSDSANANVDWQCSEAADWRFIHSAGPFTLKPGAVNFVTTGCVWAQAQSGGAKASVELVRVADKKAQALFDNCFAVLEGPRAPDLTIQELNNQLLLYISNPNVITFNNRNERYEELDPLIPALPGFDKTYNFEGYLIYQVKDATVTASETDLKDPSKARLAAQCDVKNEHGQLVNFTFNPGLNANEPILKNPTINGYNKGIRHSFKMTEDKFATGTTKNW